MNNYIFLTDEGYTYQPYSESDIPDIENLQVIGIASGENEREAFYNLMSRKRYLLQTTFDHIFCYKLSSDYKDSYSEFSIIFTRVIWYGVYCWLYRKWSSFWCFQRRYRNT